MSKSPNVVACPECPPPRQTLEAGVPAAASESSFTPEIIQNQETLAPDSQGDLEKIAAGVNAQAEREAEGQRPHTENTTNTAPGTAERAPTAPPSVRADVRPPSYAPGAPLKSRVKWHNWQIHGFNFRFPNELTLTQMLFTVNLVLLLGTVASCIVLLIWAIGEEDSVRKRLRFALLFCETGFIYFYGRECWRLADKYSNYWKHVECRHCIGMTQPNTALDAAV